MTFRQLSETRDVQVCVMSHKLDIDFPAEKVPRQTLLMPLEGKSSNKHTP